MLGIEEGVMVICFGREINVMKNDLFFRYSCLVLVLLLFRIGIKVVDLMCFILFIKFIFCFD